MPYTTLVAGTTITAAWANANVRDQGIPVFATAASRDSAVTSPIEGMHAYTSDTNTLWFYTGTVWVRRSPAFASVSYVSGDFTLNNTNYTDIHASALDLTLPASAGDVIEYTMNGGAGNQAVNLSLDVFITANSTYFSSNTTTPLTFGRMGWRCATGVESQISGGASHVVVAGDISGGNITMRPRYRTDTATNRTLYGGGTAGTSLYLSARNFGPA